MEITKVIVIDHNSLGFEVGEDSKWRGEFTLEQVAQYGIKAGKDLTVHLLEMEDTFATVEFNEDEKTTVPITKVPESGDLFFPEAPEETDTPDFSDTIQGRR